MIDRTNISPTGYVIERVFLRDVDGRVMIVFADDEAVDKFMVPYECLFDADGDIMDSSDLLWEHQMPPFPRKPLPGASGKRE